MDIEKWDPFKGLSFRDSIRFPSILDQFFLEGPAMDVLEEDDALIVKAEVPGLTKDDISVELQDRTLTISGKKKVEKDDEGKKYYRKL